VNIKHPLTSSWYAETIRRNRRGEAVSIDMEEVKLLEQRFTRIGKEKSAQSALAYKDLTEHVICRGTPELHC
jgi:hypothetical protein